MLQPMGSQSQTGLRAELILVLRLSHYLFHDLGHFLLPWTWGISSRLLQQITVTTPLNLGYLLLGTGHGVSPPSCSLLQHCTAAQGKRNPHNMTGAERGHQRADSLEPQSQKTNQPNHRSTVLSNSMKLNHAV